MIIEEVGEEKFQILYDYGKFRVCNISRLESVSSGKITFAHTPFETGLAIEYKCRDGNYIVVSTVRVEDDEVDIDWVRDTVLTFPVDELALWQKAMKDAYDFLDNVVNAKKELL